MGLLKQQTAYLCNMLKCTADQTRIRSGFTLIELVLYIGIASIMLLVTSVFLSTLLESRIKNQTIAEVEQQGIQAMQIITQTLRNADEIVAPKEGKTAGSLSLRPFNISESTVFDISGGAIRITEGAGSAVLLTNLRVTAAALTFQNLSRANTPGTIRISFTLAHVNPAGRNAYNFSKIFYGSASLRRP